MTNKPKSRRRNGKAQASASQDTHVPVNNFNLEELRRFAGGQTIPKTYRIHGYPHQYTTPSVVLPMADGTSLLQVIESELARLGHGRVTESRTETPNRLDTPVQAAPQRSMPSKARDEVDRSLEVAAPIRSHNPQSTPSEARHKVETRASNSSAADSKPGSGPSGPATVTSSKEMIDPNKASMTIRLIGISDQAIQDYFCNNRVPLTECMAEVQTNLRQLCSLFAYANRGRLAMMARDRKCFHFRARPDLVTDITRNFYITYDEHSSCRLERVRDLFHTHQIDSAARDNVPLMLRFCVEMIETDMPNDDGDSDDKFKDCWAPQFGLWSVEWEEDAQDVRSYPMTAITDDAAENTTIEIYKDLTATPQTQILSIAEQEQKFASIVSQVPEKHDKLRLPLMTFNRYDRDPAVAPTQTPNDLYLAVRIFSRLAFLECSDMMPAAPAILLKVPADRSADKVKRVLMQQLQLYCSAQSIPQPRSEYREPLQLLLEDRVRGMWNLQLWAMPQGQGRNKLHICRKKEDWREFLAEGGGEGLYVEGHLVPSEAVGKGMFGEREEKHGEDGEAGGEE